jgi:hypothetical protein
MAFGERSDAEYTAFLRSVLRLAIRCSADGAIHFVCIDWRGLRLMLEVTDDLHTELKNICDWNKTNAGKGALYRSKHELILAVKAGSTPHINNVALSTHGPNRTNLWEYAGHRHRLRAKRTSRSLPPTAALLVVIAGCFDLRVRMADHYALAAHESGEKVIACCRSLMNVRDATAYRPLTIANAQSDRAARLKCLL